jgi:hypothetical protein
LYALIVLLFALPWLLGWFATLLVIILLRRRTGHSGQHAV